jgi:hypothetical protein
MLKHSFALFFILVTAFLASPALGQNSSAQSPIVCESKDDIEDAVCQNKLKGLFTREGDTLTLKLDDGKSKPYSGNRAACDGGDTSKCLIFRVLNYFSQTKSYLIRKIFYECGAYLLISRHTGSETIMYSIPVLSPNAKYLLSIDKSDACDRKYDIAIWSMQADPPKLEFNYLAAQYENWEVTAWENDARIKMKAWINGATSYQQEAELIRKANGWTLDLGRKTDIPR